MAQSEASVVARLAELTAALVAAPGTPSGSLERARRLLVEALLNSQSESVTDATAAAGTASIASELQADATDELTRIVREVSQATRDPSLKVFRRTWPMLVSHLPQSVPSWAGAWAAQETLGPFETAEGTLVWWDVRRTAEHFLVVEAQSGAAILALPRATLRADTAMTGVSQFVIPEGSVWLSAALFDGKAPHGAFAGVRIVEGSLVLSEPGMVSGALLRVGQGCVLTVQLQVQSEGTPQQRTSVALPESLEFTLAVGGAGTLTAASRGALDAYGNHIGLTHKNAARPRYEPKLARLCFPFTADRQAVAVDGAGTQVLRLSGEAGIREAAWSMPVAVPQSASPADLGEASGAGAFVIQVADGLWARIEPMLPSHRMRVDRVSIVCEPSHVSVLMTAPSARYHREMSLWASEARGYSRIALRASGAVTISFDAATTADAPSAAALGPLQCSARVDRPITGAGEPVSFEGSATLHIVRRGVNTRLLVDAAAQVPPHPALTFALSNALVRTGIATGLQAGAVLNDPWQTARGGLLLHFPMVLLVPSLPDPYAANITAHAPRFDEALYERTRSLLIARVRFRSDSDVTLSFAIAGSLPDPSRLFLRAEEPPIQNEAGFAARGRDYLSELEALFPRATSQGAVAAIRMLDVSSRVDLFGVGFGPAFDVIRGEHTATVNGTAIGLRGLELIAPIRNVSAFTLPAFQWEPVYDVPNANALFPPKLVSPTDGGAARFATPAGTLVPLAPRPVFDALIAAYGHDSSLATRFTLPFGMVAFANLQRERDHGTPALGSPRVGSVAPRFTREGLHGGLQLVLQAPLHPIEALGKPSPGLPGVAVQTDNAVGGYNVLKSGFVDQIFNERFAAQRPLVPVRRIDFSGYGASTFSDWRHEHAKGTDVTQVRLEAIVGRASREVVQVRARLVPWGAIVVRIITMERSGSGGVFRRDSGWVAASDAQYDLPGCTVHAGIVQKLKNIRRIRDTSNVYERHYPTAGASSLSVKLTQVVFDADAQIEGVTRGADPSGLVPARDIIGYVQILPSGEELGATHIDDLLATTGAVGGPIDCEANVAQSGLSLRLARIEVDRTRTLGNVPQFVAVARGATEIASAGEWTFVYRNASGAEFHRLDVSHPVPLIRQNAGIAGVAPYRFAEARELHRPTNPDSEYAILQSTGAQRMLIPQPQLRWGDAAIHGGAPLLFADMYTLSSGGSLFPRPDQCHPLPAGSVVRITGRGKVRLDIPPQAGLGAGEFRVGPLERKLSESAALRVRSRFQSDSKIRLSIDSQQQPQWSCAYGPVALLSDMDDLEEIVSTVGTVESSAHAAPQLKDPKLVFGGALKPVQSVIEILTWFGVPFDFDLAVTNAPSTYSFKSGWKYCFPKYSPFEVAVIDEHIKNGPGLSIELELRGRWGREGKVAKEIEKEFGEHALISTKGIPKGPDADKWHFSVESEAKILARVGTLGNLISLWAGGGHELEIGAEESGKTKITYAAIMAGAIELKVPYLLSLTGTRTLSFGFEHKFGEKQIALRCATGLEVELEFFSGLAAGAVSFELIGVIKPAEEYEVTAEGTVAVDLTVAWMLSKTYEIEFTIKEKIKAEHFNPGSLLP